MGAKAVITEYYAALEAGDSIYRYFSPDHALVKFGIGERLWGYQAIQNGLQAQTATTDGWIIDSDSLSVTEHDSYAWFGDEVFMAWTDVEKGIRYEFDTRWSGSLIRNSNRDEPSWQFVEMHVSVDGST